MLSRSSTKRNSLGITIVRAMSIVRLLEGTRIALAFQRSNLVIASSFLLDSFVAQEDHTDGRDQATRNVHLMSKGRSMTPPPQIQPR